MVISASGARRRARAAALGPAATPPMTTILGLFISYSPFTSTYVDQAASLFSAWFTNPVKIARLAVDL
jgi:hypothetical protein